MWHNWAPNQLLTLKDQLIFAKRDSLPAVLSSQFMVTLKWNLHQRIYTLARITSLNKQRMWSKASLMTAINSMSKTSNSISCEKQVAHCRQHSPVWLDLVTNEQKPNMSKYSLYIFSRNVTWYILFTTESNKNVCVNSTRNQAQKATASSWLLWRLKDMKLSLHW